MLCPLRSAADATHAFRFGGEMNAKHSPRNGIHVQPRTGRKVPALGYCPRFDYHPGATAVFESVPVTALPFVAATWLPLAVALRLLVLILLVTISDPVSAHDDAKQDVASRSGDAATQAVLDYENRRIKAIETAMPSVVAIYDDQRQGGGSGVIITPSGLALTNHHVIVGAGVKGWGGIAGNKLFRWKLIGTDPGGDVSLIQMIGDEPFPYSPLGDSDRVRVGDWALAMGNPFILTEDQSPTVTLGIVSGVKRYQPGAGQNQLVYGNCIQVDSSINPGNSGGPLFNFDAKLIGINGRGSFQDRGRVNVGLGYAISINQIKNFLPELLATKLVEHGTLDANFTDRDGRVVCSTVNLDAISARQGLALGDVLLEFDCVPIQTANQFTNLICTLPAGWPATLKLEKPGGETIELTTRLLGLPYARPKIKGGMPGPDGRPPEGKDPPSREAQDQQRQMEMVRLLSADPGTIRDPEANQRYAQQLIASLATKEKVASERERDVAPKSSCCRLVDDVQFAGDSDRRQRIVTLIAGDGRFIQQAYAGEDDDTPLWTVTSEANAQPAREGVAAAEQLTFQLLPMAVVERNAIAVDRQPFSKDASDAATFIDGSDKISLRNAWRFRVDKKRQRIFWWAAMNLTEPGQLGEMLRVTVGPPFGELNDSSAAVDMQQWENVSGMLVPTKREFRGAREDLIQVIANASEELDADQFALSWDVVVKREPAGE